MIAWASPVILATGVVLAAVDMPTWRELTALAMVGLILRWMIARENRREVRDHQVDKATMRRLHKLEGQVRDLQESVADQRHLKHELGSRLIAARNALELVRLQARRCSCGALDPIVQLLEELPHDSHP